MAVAVFPSLLSLETSFRHPLADPPPTNWCRLTLNFILLWWCPSLYKLATSEGLGRAFGGQSGASLLLVLCVGAVDMWVMVYFFSFPSYDLSEL
uniref:Uncharacterized protein n=1 Tax=Oryza nivara TaxID=4536 RepID=A0A0E0IG23_ORYNI